MGWGLGGLGEREGQGGSHLDNVMVSYKDVHWLDISVDDLVAVQRLQALTHLDEVLPDDVLRKHLLQLVPLLDEARQITVGSVLHHNAQEIPCSTNSHWLKATQLHSAQMLNSSNRTWLVLTQEI